ncbi:TetR/AcrR family transcriptional regulator C-terminal domain-containing protein [Actinoplanes sp. NBC_00393]|uniref:TetR/AcrR family transcriptional regulator C-terminal domain-containing protein n=1 Tax=Actinoplanes sp. NBC_00393 TaxID=2975953 RepID=UPI002E1FC408
MEQPAHRRIAAEIADRIVSGELAPGDRIPSTRQIVADHGVAMATASKVIAALREQGLVQAVPGSGTVVSHGAGSAPATPDRERVVLAAVQIADAEGLPGLSMRRLAGSLGIPTMSLYRHVADKEELVLLMMDRVMAEHPPPLLVPAVHGWRACLEGLARLQWSMYRRHTWLAEAISFTRPMLAPHAMAHTEYMMWALDGHGLDPSTQFTAAVMVANYVRGTAVNLEGEAQAEQESGLSEAEWLESQQARLAAVLASGELPMIARFIASGDHSFDLDTLLEFGLQRLLDGLEPLLRQPGRTGASPVR